MNPASIVKARRAKKTTLPMLACCYNSPKMSTLHVLVRQLEVTEPVRHYDLVWDSMKRMKAVARKLVS